MHKLVFHTSEMYYIDVKKLKIGDIIDKDYLISIFGEQSCLGAHGHKGILEPNPQEYFTKIQNPIDNETKNKIIKIFGIVNKHHKKNNSNYIDINNIKILKTFAFAPYILSGFIVTYIFGNELIKYFMFLIGKIFYYIYNY